MPSVKVLFDTLYQPYLRIQFLFQIFFYNYVPIYYTKELNIFMYLAKTLCLQHLIFWHSFCVMLKSKYLSKIIFRERRQKNGRRKQYRK